MPYKSLTNQDIALRFEQLVVWTISIRCGLLLHDGFLPLRGRKMRRKVTSLSSETLKLNIFYSFLKTFSLKIGPRELLRLAHSELQEWQETAHTNSYIPDTTSKCSKCYFQCQVGSSLLIKHFLKPLARLKVANLSPSLYMWKTGYVYPFHCDL